MVDKQFWEDLKSRPDDYRRHCDSIRRATKLAMRKHVVEIAGKRFGRLTALEYVRDSLWKCKCDCGVVKLVDGYGLRDGRINSCGCGQREWAGRMADESLRKYPKGLKHKDRLYGIWCGMKQRCNNSNYREFRYYGGRGIKVCDEWENDFLAFYKWAISNGYGSKLSIDRINNDGGYSPKNCRWATNEVQSRNQRLPYCDRLVCSKHGEDTPVRGCRQCYYIELNSILIVDGGYEGN